MRKDKSYHWIKINDKWIIGQWAKNHYMWHLADGSSIRDGQLQEIDENEITHKS